MKPNNVVATTPPTVYDKAIRIKDRHATFRASLLHRDVVCVCSGSGAPYDLMATYIIHPSWRKHDYIGLPSGIQEELEDVSCEVNSPMNGLLLHESVAHMFERGQLLVVPVDSDNKILPWATLPMEDTEAAYEEPSKKYDRFAFYAFTPDAAKYHMQPAIHTNYSSTS